MFKIPTYTIMILESRDKMKGKVRIITVSTIAFLGVLCISSGIIMPAVIKTEGKQVIKFSISQKRVSKAKKNELKLKDMESEINTPLSVNIKDYLVYDLEDKILKKLKLDTSTVNVTEAGTYTYTITYKKKIFNGKYVIKEKPLPTIDNMTLKSLKLEKGATLSTDLSTYIIEAIPEEAKIAIQLDLSAVNVNVAGVYQYTVTYNGKFYTGNIEIFEPQVKLPPQEQTKTEDSKKAEEDKTKTETKKEETPTT